jgi:hypothetical protein
MGIDQPGPMRTVTFSRFDPIKPNDSCDYVHLFVCDNVADQVILKTVFRDLN